MNKQTKMAALIIGSIILLIGAAIAYYGYQKKKKDEQNFSLGKFVLEAIAGVFRSKELPLLPSVNIRYTIMTNARLNRVPYWLAFTIAKIESNFNTQAHGPTGDYGMFQITQPVLTDFNLMGLEHSGLTTPLNLQDMLDPQLAAIVACWQIGRLYGHFNQNVQNTVKAYNTGIGGINSAAATAYWNRFQAERPNWEGLDYSKL